MSNPYQREQRKQNIQRDPINRGELVQDYERWLVKSALVFLFFKPWYWTNLDRGRIEVRRRFMNGYIRSTVLDA
jgi:hypothetical protein